MSEKTVAEAFEALRKYIDLSTANRVLNLCKAVVAESLPAQPKAEAGEPRTFDATLYGPGPGHAPTPERINAVASELMKEPAGEEPEPHDDPRIYPCDSCGMMRSKREGGNVFTVCDACWDKLRSTRAATTATDAGSGGASKEDKASPNGGSVPTSPGAEVTKPPEPVHPSQEQPAASGPETWCPSCARMVPSSNGENCNLCGRATTEKPSGIPGRPAPVRYETIAEMAEIVRSAKGEPSGGAPSDEELSSIATLAHDVELERQRARAEPVDRHATGRALRRALFEAGAASRDALLTKLRELATAIDRKMQRGFDRDAQETARDMVRLIDEAL